MGCISESWGCMCDSCCASRRYDSGKADVAYVVQVEDRFYVGENKRGHMVTGWSLASAKLFRSSRDALAIKRVAEMKRKRAAMHMIKVPMIGGA